MRKVVFALVALGFLPSCEREDPARVGEDYLTFIEQGDYAGAYRLVDKISREHVTEEQFVKYWQDAEAKYGKPIKHEILETGQDSGVITIDYYWYYQPPASGDTSHYESMRYYRLNLKRDFRGWRVKFLKYTVTEKPR